MARVVVFNAAVVIYAIYGSYNVDLPPWMISGAVGAAHRRRYRRREGKPQCFCTHGELFLEELGLCKCVVGIRINYISFGYSQTQVIEFLRSQCYVEVTVGQR